MLIDKYCIKLKRMFYKILKKLDSKPRSEDESWIKDIVNKRNVTIIVNLDKMYLGTAEGILINNFTTKTLRSTSIGAHVIPRL